MEAEPLCSRGIAMPIGAAMLTRVSQLAVGYC